MDSEQSTISLILLSHGHLCDSIYQTSKLIMGEQPDVHCISTANLPPGEILGQIMAIVDAPGNRRGEVLVAVDLKGGNTWNVACRLAHERQNVAVISGMNLPILLTFFTKRGSASLNQLVDSLVAAGKKSIEKFQADQGGE